MAGEGDTLGEAGLGDGLGEGEFRTLLQASFAGSAYGIHPCGQRGVALAAVGHLLPSARFKKHAATQPC